MAIVRYSEITAEESCCLKKNAQCESCELSFIWGKMWTIAWETVPQLAPRNCSKEVERKVSIHVVLVRRQYMQSSTFFWEWFYLSRGAVITVKDFSAFIDTRRYKTWAHKIGSWKYLKICSASFSLGIECLIFALLSELLSGGVEIQQLQQHMAQSLQSETLSAR